MLRILIFLVSLGARAVRAICRCRADLEIGTQQRHSERKSHHAATVTRGQSRRAAASGRASPSLRMARGCLSRQFECGLGERCR